jgi:hypothetical protein
MPLPPFSRRVDLVPPPGTWLHDFIRDLQASTQAKFVGDGEHGPDKGGVGDWWDGDAAARVVPWLNCYDW